MFSVLISSRNVPIVKLPANGVSRVAKRMNLHNFRINMLELLFTVNGRGGRKLLGKGEKNNKRAGLSFYSNVPVFEKRKTLNIPKFKSS